MRAAVLAGFVSWVAWAWLAGAGCWTSTAAPGGAKLPIGAGEPARGSADELERNGADELERGSHGIAPITCIDVGIVLRGPVDGPTDARPAKERTIAQACVEDAWPRAVIDCVGRGKKDCLEKLTAAQRRSYDARLARWRSRFVVEPSADGGDVDDADAAP